jgi:hypothetical protein
MKEKIQPKDENSKHYIENSLMVFDHSIFIQPGPG